MMATFTTVAIVSAMNVSLAKMPRGVGGNALRDERRVQKQVVRHNRSADDRNDDEDRTRRRNGRYERTVQNVGRHGAADEGQLEKHERDAQQRGTEENVEHAHRLARRDAEQREDHHHTDGHRRSRSETEHQLRAEHDPGEFRDVGRNRGDLEGCPEQQARPGPAARDQRPEIRAVNQRHACDRDLHDRRDRVREQDDPQQRAAERAGR
jgi:hypothetical protein